MEIGYSNKSRRAPHLADEYILGADCSIKAVVVLDIDIDYRSSKGTTVLRSSQPPPW